MTRLRPFTDGDYDPVTEIHNRIFPNDPFSPAEWRYRDATWEADRFFRERLTVLTEEDEIVGWGEVAHIPDRYHPDKYQIDLAIDPAHRRRGHGGVAYDALSVCLRARGGVSIQGWVKESEPEAIAFVTKRGYVERRREWQSRLDVTAFDPAPFAGVRERVAASGIVLTDLQTEQARNPNALTDVYALDQLIMRDVPDLDAHTETSFDHFIKTVIEGPGALPAAFLLARDGDRSVGLARMFASAVEPDLLFQGLTGVIPAYRGRGIAMALKLETVACAVRLGKRHITTWNDTANRAMLRINEAMGFVKEPAEIVVVREFPPSAASAGTVTDD